MDQMPPPGWFPDPERAGQLRYWDGAAWTEDRAPGQGPGGSAVVPAPASQWAPAAPHLGGPQPGYATQVAAKSPGIALLVSFFIPGLGSMMNGEVGKGIGILVGYVVSFFLIIVLVGIAGVIGFWIWGMVDAYQGARKWNARHGIIS